MKLRLQALIAALAVACLGATSSVLISAIGEHERLRIQNTFKSPEEVVRYYCARDASGFVWSGLLDSERQAFTLWKEPPQHESFYIAKRYEIIPSPISTRNPDSATVEVRYQVVGIGDAMGSMVPPSVPVHRVQFDLKRIGGVWKIAKPDPQGVSPVVLESKFPVVAIQ